MIIYENTVTEFINISKTPNKLAVEIKGNLKTKFGISVAANEYNSWTRSLPQVAKLIEKVDGDKRKVLIEFNVPTTKQRIDFILLGKNKHGKPSAWLLELKQWSQVTEQEWNEFRVGRYIDSHPSDQALKYTEKLNHQMGLVNDVDIKSGAFLHNLKDPNSPLYNKTYWDKMQKALLYSFNDQEKLAQDMHKHTIIKEGDEALHYFKSAKWAPTKKFKEQMQDDFNSLVLTGTQKTIYEKIERFIKKYDKKQKVTFIISGDPGSGKTIIAFKLLVLFLKDLDMSMQLMLPGQELRNAVKHNLKSKDASSLISGASLWRENDAALIDEAHKAIGRDTGTVNYKRIYEKLNFGVVFIDNDQVINKKGLEKEQIISIAKKSGHIIHEYNIEENFRNNGERTLIDWIDTVIYKKSIMNGDFEYKQTRYINKYRGFKLYSYDDINQFLKSYYDLQKNNHNTRITTFWTRSYYIGPADENGEIPRHFKIGNYSFAWNPNEEWWKQISTSDKQTYSSSFKKYATDRKQYLVGNPNKDYLAYFNHIQGYEFDNIFVYISNVFTYENNEIVFHRDRLAKEVRKSQTWAPYSKAKELGNRDPYLLNKKYFLNRLKVMLTRGTKSTHFFAEDRKLNDYLKSTIE